MKQRTTSFKKTSLNNFSNKKNRTKMGSYLGIDKMPETIRAKMIRTQQEMAMKQREMMMAVQVARARESFWWLFSATCGIAVVGTIGLIKTRKPFGLFPLYPLTFYNAWLYDMAYGFPNTRPKALRIRDMAEQIIIEENSKGDDNRFLLPANNLLISRETYLDIMKR